MPEYKDTINEICCNIHTDLIDFSKAAPRKSAPTQASSEFITNKQQGDWAEDVIFRAINDNSENIVAVRYGKSDDLTAGDPGFKEFYAQYQEELETIGKRPDLLIFRKDDYDEHLGHDISYLSSDVIGDYIKKAIVGIEVRSSAFLIDKYNEETNRSVRENTEKAIELKNIILSEYTDMLEKKRPELIGIIQSIDEHSVRSVDFRVPAWRSSSRLQTLSGLLSELKNCLKTIQKRNTLSITPKVEDLKSVYKWIMNYNVPHFYVQVFFDKIYGISFKHILELISDPELEDEIYTIEEDIKNQNKTTIKIPPYEGICLAETVSEPRHYSVRKELNKGRLLFYVKFDGGGAVLDKKNFDELFGCEI